jgi:glycosyltransferase involved in cell wall biosynthesis/tetratricopeptide (TPR) repeat protein/GT2 family glycosyltransferase
MSSNQSQIQSIPEKFSQAQKLQSEGKVSEAIAEYRAVLELDKKYLAAWHQLAQLLEAQKKWDEAAEHYRKAIELDPQPPFWVRRHFGFSLYQQGLFDEAIVAYQKAIAVQPEEATIHSLLGQAFGRNGDVEGAIESYQRAIELSGNLPVWVYLNLGDGLRQIDRLDEAISAYEKALALEPENAGIQRLLEVATKRKEANEGDRCYRAKQLQREGQLEEALAEYRAVLAEDGSNLVALHQVAQICETQGKWDEAVEGYRRAIDLDADSPFWVYRHLGFALSQLGNLDEAVAAYEKAVELNPEDGATQSLLGYARKKKGDLEGAIFSYHRAIELDPESPVWVYSSLDELLSQREHKEAEISVSHAHTSFESQPNSLTREPKSISWQQLQPQIAAVLADYCQTIDKLGSRYTESREGEKLLRAICLAVGNNLIESGHLAEATQFYQRVASISINPVVHYQSNYLDDIKNHFKNLITTSEVAGKIAEAETIAARLKREIIDFHGFNISDLPKDIDYFAYQQKYRIVKSSSHDLSINDKIFIFEDFIDKIQLVNSCGIFDREFYLATNSINTKPENTNAISVISQYIESGYLENTHPLFTAYYYINQEPFLAEEQSINPLIHYLEIGWHEGRDPHPMFDTSYYLERNPDIEQAGINPLEHFIKFAGQEGKRNPHPLFDTSYYLENNPDLKGTGLNPLQHFIEFGVWEERNPHPLFNVSYYRENNPDVVEAGINAVQHFMEIGAFKQRDPHPLLSIKNYTDYLESIGRSLKPTDNPLIHYLQNDEKSSRFACFPWRSSQASILDQEGHYDILVFSHDGSRTGAPRVLLAFLQQLKEYQSQQKFTDINIWTILVRDGELRAEFEECGLTLVLSELDEWTGTHGKNLEELLESFKKFSCNPLVLVNTSAISQINEVCYHAELPMVSWIHELPVTIESYCGGLDSFKHILLSSKKIISVSDFVASSLIEYSNQQEQADKYITIYAAPPSIKRDETLETIEFYKSQLKAEFSLPDSAFIVIGCGTVQDRKGCDFFVQVASQVVKVHQMTDTYFIWIGAKVQPEFSMWLDDDVQKLGLEDHVIFAGSRTNPLDYMRGSDVFLLTSREDPFPLVNMEAMYCELPVITFIGNGGASEIFENQRGIAVPYLDISEMAKAVIKLKSDERLRQEIGIKAKDYIKNKLTWENFVNNFVDLIKADYDYHPFQKIKVTVIVPNYNYEKFIIERLETIINQTVKPDEIIFLDDKSLDKSPEIAIKILQETDIPYKIILNKENTGSPFKQWVKGIREATGDLIWIAESDDSCKIDLVKKLKEQFYDPDVVLAYSQSAPMGEEGQIWDRNYLSYTNELDPQKWSNHYKNEGINEITNALCLKNTIPNASAVMFRKSALTEECLSLIQRFRFVGDWLLYFSVAKEGKVAFVADSLNYHRRHGKTVTSQVEKEDSHAQEVLELKKHILSHDFVSANAITESLARTIDDYYALNERHNLNRMAFISNPSFQKSIEEIRIDFEQRYLTASHASPSILFIIGDADFGGGQIAAIRVANEFSKKYQVFLCNARPWTYNDSLIDLIDRKVILIEGSLKPKPWSGHPQRRLEVLRNLIQFHQIDTIFSHIWWGDRLAYELNQELKLPWFIQMHGCYENLLDHPEIDSNFIKYIEPMMKSVSGVAYLTDKNLNVFDRLNINRPNKIARFFNGFDRSSVDFNSPEAKLINRSDDDFVFCLCSRPIPEKGWEEAIQATLAINKLPPEQRSNKTARLFLIGDNDYAQELKLRYTSHEEITFLGQQKHPTNFYSQCDVGLLPSKFKSESVPCCIIEYLACNLPVIATTIGSIPEMISFEEAEAGLLIPLANDLKIDIEILEETMLYYITNKSLYWEHKRNSQIIFNRLFDMEKLSLNYIKFFKLN